MITTLAQYGIALNGILIAVHTLLMVFMNEYPTQKGYLILSGHFTVIAVLVLLISYAAGK